MTPEQIQELIDQLFSMGETMATEAFRIALLQVRVGIVTSAVWVVFLALSMYPVAKVLKHGLKELEKNEYSGWIFGVVFSAIYIVIGVLVIPVLLTDVASHLINPEWYAIKEIMGLLK